MADERTELRFTWDDHTWSILDAARRRLEESWRSRGKAELAEFIPVGPDDPRFERLLARLIPVDRKCRVKAGRPRGIEEYLNDWPQLRAKPELLAELHAGADFLDTSHEVSDALKETADHQQPVQPEPLSVRCPHCSQLVEPDDADPTATLACPSCGSRFPLADAEKADKKRGADELRPGGAVAHFELIEQRGGGTFGVVWKARDAQLDRTVAVKIPRRGQFDRQQTEEFLHEARAVASLDHAGIVPVYAADETADGLCYIVSKFIEGSDLRERVKQSRPCHAEAAELVAGVAEALHHAHNRGLVHRDIKPANILLDTHGKPHVADFGLALKEADFGKGPELLGTPFYMSPEQARREGHLVDGRSDVFSLGVVFYELLTGVQPFTGKDRWEVMERIRRLEPRPPRMLDDTIPKELERICLKALSKRATDRYNTAFDFADDLRQFQDRKKQAESVARPVKIVPKGLRSFDADDADFFLELLPGPRDREGLPESIRFWKTRIEEPDPDKTFRVGLIYGPCGCGKSSLVKAGLLPRLTASVARVYVESTAEETEIRLLRGLRKRCPGLPEDLSLAESLAAIRRGEGVAAGSRVLIVLDQFEQWLHARRGQQDTQLVQALRQCDGQRVQCLVMVRDDFWMAATWFMRELEIPLLEGQNSAAVDLFDLRHARGVLAAFGAAFGALPEDPGKLTEDQQSFLDRAAAGLAQEGKVVCVRLALFAEMIKGRPWTPASLKDVGGTEGIGVTFLEETFTAATAPPGHRLHQKAARSVLRGLLPEQGTDIKGHMRSSGELLETSGYAGRAGDFHALLRILDAELRLVTPTDPQGLESDEVPPDTAEEKYYQLTHDFLVPPLREWLTRKQKETRRGRAELRLAERSAVWNAKPEIRHLPSLSEWFNIRSLTRQRDRTQAQAKMLRAADRYHVVRACVALVVLGLVTVAAISIRGRVIEQQQATRAAGLVKGLLDAEITQVPGIVAEIGKYRRWADPLLREAYHEAPLDSPRKLHAGLALLPADSALVDYVYDQLLRAEPDQFPVVREALSGHKQTLVGRLWGVLEGTRQGNDRRFRAACALAAYDPVDGKEDRVRWQKISQLVADQLVAAILRNPSHYLPAVDALRPARRELLASLSTIFRDAERGESERLLATSILADYAAEQPGLLADLLADADTEQFGVLFAKLQAHGDRAISRLTRELDRKSGDAATETDKELLARRKANAAVALYRMGRAERVWPLLRHGPDPRIRSYVIHRLRPLGADAAAVVKRLDEEQEVSIQRALILCVGEFSTDRLSLAERGPLIAGLLQMYRDNVDPGIHGATEWVLRRWNQQEKLAEIDRQLAAGKPQGDRRWYLNAQGQTMVVIKGPVEFLMGSPESEKDRDADETLHRRRIGHTFALSTKEVTVEQFRRFDPGFFLTDMYRCPEPDCPIIAILWYQAAEYCNWLSKQEGIAEDQWCYLPNQSGEFAEGMKPAPDFLSRTGYRLPVEAEWEYACRAGAVTSRHYGQTEELLSEYAWYFANAKNRTWPVAALKPNDLGLFDMHGNVYEWCQERYASYPRPAEGEAAELPEIGELVKDSEWRLLRGSSFFYLPRLVRTAVRYSLPPTFRSAYVGLRVARTCDY